MRTHYDNLHITETETDKKSATMCAKAAILCAVCFLWSSSAMAEFLGTGAKFFPRVEKIIQGEINTFEAVETAGFVEGVSDAHAGRTICAPADTSVRQMSFIIHSYMSKNPGMWNLSAATLVERALSSQWPCYKTGLLDDLE